MALPRKLKVLAFILFALFSHNAKAQDYDAGPNPDINDIQHQTVSEAYGLSRNRTSIAIGEDVDCSIDPASWSDTDLSKDESGDFTVPESDEMGPVTWSCSGLAWVYPVVGTQTRLHAQLAGAASSIVVYAAVADSGVKGVDAPKIKQVTFAAVVPTHVHGGTVVWKNTPYGTKNAQNPHSIGAQTEFLFKVQPQTVDFGYGGNRIRENIGGGTVTVIHTCPDGVTQIDIPPNQSETTIGTGQLTVPETNAVIYAINYAGPDQCTTGWVAENAIKKSNGTYTEDHWDVPQPFEYWTGLQWKRFCTNYHGFTFIPASTTKAGISYVSWGGDCGSDQGPYSENAP